MPDIFYGLKFPEPSVSRSGGISGELIRITVNSDVANLLDSTLLENFGMSCKERVDRAYGGNDAMNTLLMERRIGYISGITQKGVILSCCRVRSMRCPLRVVSCFPVMTLFWFRTCIENITRSEKCSML